MSRDPIKPLKRFVKWRSFLTPGLIRGLEEKQLNAIVFNDFFLRHVELPFYYDNPIPWAKQDDFEERIAYKQIMPAPKKNVEGCNLSKKSECTLVDKKLKQGNQLDPFSDTALMLNVKNGDTDKLGLLFERHSRSLFGFFYRMTHRSDISEDLTQNVFMRMLTYRHTYTGDGNFKTWMFRIARNVLSDHHRSDKKMGERDELANIDEMMYGEVENAEQKLEKQDRKQLLWHAIDKLEETKREIIIMNRYHGLTYREIAEVMNSSENAIKVKAFRAMKELREWICPDTSEKGA